jgi:dienelactone hydrolase
VTGVFSALAINKEVAMVKITSSFQRLREYKKWKVLKNTFTLGPKAWQGAAVSLLACSAILFLSIFIGTGLFSFFNGLFNLGFAVLLVVLSFLLGSLIVKILGWIQALPQTYRWALFGAFVLLINVLIATVKLPGNVLSLAIYFVLTTSLLGAGIGALISAKKEGRPRLVPATLSIAGGLGLCILLIWFAWPGQPYTVPDQGGSVANSPQTPAGFKHPAEVGPYQVLQMTYGSGNDKRRSEYGQSADLITETADVSKMVDAPMAPVLWLRDTYWGFGLDAVPLNARVWYPEGGGPFPLVLIVHGNHMMDDFSDPGYDYLGALLASRGYIVASLDQNFLNAGGFIEAMLGGLNNENDARAYLLLRHLALWHRWNETSGHRFERLVDTDHIALIGHSRGGEAAAIAAAFNYLPCHPGNGDIRFDFGFKIKSVIAIAPSDGQFQPRRQKTEMRDLNYLVLQGSADSDVRSFQGAMQYDRVTFTAGSDHFKASVYIHGANHGQFNTRWGRIDQTFSRLFLDRSNIMPAELQEWVAKSMISSFLEATLKGRREYQQIFTNQLIMQSWVPGVSCLIQHYEGTNTMIADYEEDLDLTTITIEGGRAWGENLLSWLEEPVELGSGSLRDSMSVHLSWPYDSEKKAAYTLALPENMVELQSVEALYFTVANASVNLEPVDFTIMLKDRAGEEAALPLSHIASLPTSPQYRMFKKPLSAEFLAEPVFTTYRFLLTDFKQVNISFNPEAISEISFIFLSSAGTIYLDEVGFHHID